MCSACGGVDSAVGAFLFLVSSLLFVVVCCRAFGNEGDCVLVNVGDVATEVM